MKERLRRLMQGRYGVDELSKMMVYASFVVMIVGSFAKNPYINLAGFMIIIYSYSRIFSKNQRLRSAQNLKYMQLRDSFLRKISNQIQIMKLSKTYRVYSCPGCKQLVRVPKGKGRIEVKCPKCGTRFSKNS
ncbi:MAG: zinc-ribbon domain-containing protein [Youngiibacter sp.]|nr:zinc-ribbon domain-containing protein [Youngiibacter sp.]